MDMTRYRIAVVVGALIGGVLLLLTSGTASASVKPNVGIVGQWNTPMCGSNNWERIKTPQAEWAVIDSRATCVDSWRYHPDFNVAKVLYDTSWQDPSLIVGYVPTGEPTCASTRNTCFTFPVQVKHDGAPVMSYGTWISRGYLGNENLDLWFSPVKSRHSIQTKAGDTEIMVWPAWYGTNGGHTFSAYATIDGQRWGIMTWTAGGPHRYVAYLKLGGFPSSGHQVNVRGLWLNPFLRNAEAHGWLTSSEWWWMLAAGFEMNHAGLGNNYHAVTLTGLPTTLARTS